MPINVNRIIHLYVIILLLGILALTGILISAREPKTLRIYFFDVGQGDSILIRTPDRQTILVDGGPDQTILRKIGEALPWYDHTIDLMILTHPHADHLAGLIAVLGRYHVARVLSTGVVYQSSLYQAWHEAIAAEGSEVTIADHRGVMVLGGGTVMDVLFPGESLSGKTVSNLNNSSIVVRIIYDNFGVLLPGDQEQGEALASQRLIQPVTVLKVGHHGSRNGSGSEFLLAARPALAVISVGSPNRYGHPHRELLDQLALTGARVLRTDRDGTVMVESTGQRWWVRP